jgi:nitrite reductase/ring-hydroxylating ferredoxin subunit
MTDASWVEVARAGALVEDQPVAASVEGVDLVVVRHGASVHVLSGRCPHRAAHFAQHGVVEGDVLVCQRHGWDYRLDTGAPPRGIGEGLACFAVRCDPDGGAVHVSLESVRAHARSRPPVFHLDEDVD